MREYIVLCANTGEVFLVTHNEIEADEEAKKLNKDGSGQYHVMEYDPDAPTD